MKRTLLAATILLVAMQTFAQTDTTKNSSSDTIQVGNFIIVKKPKKNVTVIVSVGNNKDIDASENAGKKKRKNVSTNWWIVDLGFTNFKESTNYSNAQAGGYLKTLNAAAGPVTENSMKLNTGKSSNVNLWLFIQKLNVSKHVLNLKYGLGLEMYNFRYNKNISYRKDPNPFVFNDTVSFSKNKLYVGYLTVPLMVNINATPNKKNGFSISAGVSAGYLVGSRNKQVSDARGKVKYKGDFDLQPFRLAAVAEVGLGPVRLFGSYSLNKLHNDGTRLELYPHAVGIRFSN